MDPNVALVLGPDPAPFELLLRRLLETSNEDRKEAERIFNLCKSQPEPLAVRLVAVIQSPSIGADIRTLAAVLLRRVIVKEQESLWPQLNPTAQAKLKTDLLSILQSELSKPIWKKVCDTISELAVGIVESSGWPELLPFMFQCVTSNDDRMKEASLIIFAQIAPYLQEPLLPHLANLHDVFLHCLQSGNISVRLAALQAASNFVQALESASDVAKFHDLLPGMVQTLSLALQSGDEATAQEILEELVEVAGVEPTYMRKQLPAVVDAMIQIAESAPLEASTRHLAIELLITLAEARQQAPGMMRKVPNFVGRVFAVLMGMLLDVEDAAEWHGAKEEDEEAGEGEDYTMAQECLDRLAIAMGGNTVLPVASQALPAFVADPDWKKRHAALICLSQIAEGCTKVMIKSIDSVVALLLGSFNDPHPRVRWAAINAVGQLATDLAPDLEQQHHATLVPALINCMNDAQNPRVQAHATAAILNFCEAANPEIMAPYLDALVKKLLELLQVGPHMVQEGALTAIAAVADCSEESFTVYYDSVMPYLVTVLTNAREKDQRMLRAKAVEAISLVGMAVGKEKFAKDAKQVMELLIALQSGPIDNDDVTMSYMLQAWTRLCKCLGQDFLPYMQIVMPPLMHSASLKPDVTISDIEDDAGEEDEEDGMETLTIGDKRIGIRTSVLEEKATACNMLCCYADELKEGFFPWIEQVAQLMVPLLKFYFHEEVRKAAVQCVPELLNDGKLAVEKGVAPAVVNGQPYLKQLVDYLIPPLVEALGKEPEVDVVVSMLESVDECIKYAGKELSAEQVQATVEELKRVVEASRERRKDRMARKATEDFDEEEEEALEEENEQEDEVIDQVGECLGSFMRTFRDAFKPFFESVSPLVLQMLDKQRPTTERRVAICIFDDVAENFSEAAPTFYPTFVPHILDAAVDAAPEIRQAACFGLGICAQRGGPAFSPYVPDTVARLSSIVSSPAAKEEMNQSASDNAASALGKIVEHQSSSAAFDSSQAALTWLAYLPVKDDKEEAKAVHAQLCSFLERSDPRVLGPGNQNLPHIVSVLLQVIHTGTTIATQETLQKSVTLLRSLPADVTSSLPPEQQAALQQALAL